MVELKLEFGNRSMVMLTKTFFNKSLEHRLPLLRKGSPIPAVCDIVDSLMARIPEAYYKEADGNIYKVEQIEASQLCLIRDMLEDVQDAHWIDYAAGPALDNIGKLLNVTRREDESDSVLRDRIKATIPTLAGGGTTKMLQQVLAPVLDVDEDDIVVGDGYLAGDDKGDNAFLLKMDGDTTDWEGNHNASNYGGSFSTGRFGQGITVSAYCFLEIATHSDFNTDSFTTYAWVKLTSAGSGVIIQRIKRIPLPDTPEWWLGVSSGVLRGYTYLSDSTKLQVDSTNPLKVGKWYLVGMTFDNSTKTLSIFQLEDGKRGRVYRVEIYSATGSKSRYLGGNDISIGGTEDLTDQFPGMLEHMGYRKHAMAEAEMIEMAYCAPGLDHYGHFNISVKGDVDSITAEQWDFAEGVVNKYKAAGTVFDGFGNKLPHNIGVDIEGMYWHYTDCSLTDSLNKVKL